MEYQYSTHKTLPHAQEALEHYYASGEVTECEYSRIRRRDTIKGTWFDVMLRD